MHEDTFTPLSRTRACNLLYIGLTPMLAKPGTIHSHDHTRCRSTTKKHAHTCKPCTPTRQRTEPTQENRPQSSYPRPPRPQIVRHRPSDSVGSPAQPAGARTGLWQAMLRCRPPAAHSTEVSPTAGRSPLRAAATSDGAMPAA